MSTEKTKEFVRDIINGNLSVEETNAVVIALRERRKLQSLENAANFRIGTVVRPFNLSPKELNECEGEIVSFSKQRKKVDLRLTKSSAYSLRFKVGNVYRGFPVSNLLEVTAPTVEDVDESADKHDSQALYSFLAT